MKIVRWLARLSFRSKIILGITAIVLLFGVLSALFASRIAGNAMLEEIKKRGLSLGLSVAGRCADPMLALDFLRLKNMVDEVKESSDDIVYVFIQDKRGRVLSHTFKGGFPVSLKDANQAPPGAAAHIQLLDIAQGERVYDFAIPVTISDERFGTVRIGLSQIKAQAAVSRLLFIIFSASLGAGLLAVMLGTLYARTVTRRLDILRKSAEEIVKGNLDVQTGPRLKRNCWEIKNCRQPECPAYGDTLRRCWYLSDTLCPECAGGGFEQKIKACQNCQVFGETSGDEIQALAEAFDFMALGLRSYINSLKDAEASIARQQQVMKTILDVTPDLVSLQDADLRYRAVNPAFCHYFSLTEAEVIGKSDAEIFPAERAEISRAEDLEILATGVPLSKEVLISNGNDRHWFHAVKVPVYDEDRIVGLLLTARDITEMKKFQEALIQTVKMEELGKLAGGVAHEINTPLGIILGYAQMLLEDLPGDSEGHEFLRIIEKHVQICRRIVADLLNFSRVSESRMEEMDINQSIEEVLDLVRIIFKQDWVVMDVSLDPHVPPIRGDREKLKQVWLNLLNNAFESIGRDGTIRVTTKMCPHGNHVVVTVADTGAGIQDKDLEKIFDPFFSTKAPGIGTGLGLSVSSGIVREHQGKIFAVSPAPPEFLEKTSQPGGAGALFVVLLPVDWQKPAVDSCEELMSLNLNSQKWATA
jgi:two-component system NtrC family sensor kinase|uniref:histidine kinase n=1 Tax=Desulfobacca acetoxidans TaxID=60893 RepID=A0A7V6A214_9BACT